MSYDGYEWKLSHLMQTNSCINHEMKLNLNSIIRISYGNAVENQWAVDKLFTSLKIKINNYKIKIVRIFTKMRIKHQYFYFQMTKE